MKWIVTDFNNLYITACGIFYSVLCIFSIVTGIMYMSGKRKLNPLELPDSFVSKLEQDQTKMKRFVFDAGLLTFVVGLIQGLTAYSIFRGYSKTLYYIALGFTIFSICSALTKLKKKFNAFPLLKSIAYILILIVLLLPNTKALFLF